MIEPLVWSAALADSIEQGIGKRLDKQEGVVGLKASISTLTYVQYVPNVIAPFNLGEPTDFVTGLDFTGGVATIKTPGIYDVSTCATLDPVRTYPANDARSITVELRHNGSIFRRGEIQSSQLFWSTASASSAIQCQAGDTLYVTWYSAHSTTESPGPAPGARVALDLGLNNLSITLKTPTG